MIKIIFWFTVVAMSFLVMVQPARADGVVAVTVGMEFYAGQYTVYPWQNSTEACTGKFQSMYGGLLPDSVRYDDFPSGGGYGYIVCYAHSLAVYGSSTYEGNLGQINYRPKPSCPANSTGTTTCTCNTGYVPTVDGLACEVPVPAVICPAANTLHSSGFFNIGTSPNGSALSSACQGGCAIKTIGSTAALGQELYISASPKFRQIRNGVWYYFTEMSYFHTGQNCSPDTPNFLADFVGAKPDMTCAAGQQMITMSGVTKCFNSDGSSTEPNSSSAVAAAKTLADAKTSAALAAAASAVAAAGGSASDVMAAQTVAAGVVGAAGGVGGATSISDPVLKSFCEQNPAASICADEELGAPPAPEMLASSAPVFTVSSVAFSSVAGCPAPQTFTITGLPFISKVYSISWQPFCDMANTLRPIFLALAAITAVFIFAGVTI